MSAGRRRGALVAMVVAVAVLTGADVAVAAAAPHLREPLFWPTFEAQHKVARLRALGSRRVSTVLFGDSVLDSAADPQLMAADGYPGAFNASLAGEVLPTISDWSARVVVPAYRPARVVLGFDVNVVERDPAAETALVHEFQHSRPVAVAEGRGDVVDRLDVWLHDHVALYRERSVLRQPFSEGSAGGAVYDPPLSPRGWNEGFAAGRLDGSAAGVAAAARALRADLFPDFRVSPLRVAALGRLVDRLRAEGAAVVFVIPPASPALPAAVSGTAALRTAEAAVAGAAAAHGARVLQAGMWPAAYFADGVHLDRAGTVRFSAWLAAELGGAP